MIKRNDFHPSRQKTFLFGGDEGDRTPYLLNAIQALSRITRKRAPGFEIADTLSFLLFIGIIVE